MKRKRVASEAKKQLKKSATVTCVAYGCGFGGVRNFNRVFKEKVGHTQTEYRKAARGYAEKEAFCLRAST